MHRYFKNFIIFTAMVSMNVEASQLLDLKNENTSLLQSFVGKALLGHPSSSITLKEINRFTDFKHVTHIRMQEYYQGYPVFQAQAVIHIPETATIKKTLYQVLTKIPLHKTMNGRLYQQLEVDLEKISNQVFNQKQANEAIQFAVNHYKATLANYPHLKIENTTSQLIVFVEKEVAHWAYQVTFDVPRFKVGGLPQKQVYIIDAITFKIYKRWDNIKTTKNNGVLVKGGGLGGNPNVGKLFYDGLKQHLASFTVTRNNGICYLQNKDIVVKHAVTQNVMHYPCTKEDAEHNHVYWSGSFDMANQGYSPANDALFSAKITKELYKKWYNLPVLINDDGSEMVLIMNVHLPEIDNAFWDGGTMTFGDGTFLYPLTSLSISAHEVSHGFTEQHSNLTYEGQSGGMNEAFSDMAAQTAEFFAYGKSSWKIGGEVFKINDESMRFMDQPSKDCYGKEPGTFCSIDSAQEYYEGLDVHFSSGVYNRAFYSLSTTADWNPRKAFAVMLQANASYWLEGTDFAEGAACAVKAAEDLQYDKKAVENAFKLVGISLPEKCTNK